MCKVMGAEWGIDWQKPSIAKRVSPAFMEEARPKVIEKLNSQIKINEAKDKEVCGSYFEDPSSPIHQAWAEREQYGRDAEAASKECNALSQKLHDELMLETKQKNVQIDLRQLEAVVNRYFDEDQEKFISCSYEQFMEKATDEVISKDLFSVYQKMMTSSLQISTLRLGATTLQGRYAQSHNKYWNLEEERKGNQGRIVHYKQQLTEFLENSVHSHLGVLTSEWSCARFLEETLNDKDSLEKCRELVEKLIKHPEERSLESFAKVRRLVNCCGSCISIWHDLYHACANHQIEDSWSEKHFVDFLPELSQILSQRIIEAQHWIDKQSREYMSNPPPFSSLLS